MLSGPMPRPPMSTTCTVDAKSATMRARLKTRRDIVQAVKLAVAFPRSVGKNTLAGRIRPARNSAEKVLTRLRNGLAVPRRAVKGLPNHAAAGQKDARERSPASRVGAP